MVQRSNPPPPRHGHGSAIVLSPSPPVVWWVCGTVPLPALWCGGGVVLSPYPPCRVMRVWYSMDNRYGM